MFLTGGTRTSIPEVEERSSAATSAQARNGSRPSARPDIIKMAAVYLREPLIAHPERHRPVLLVQVRDDIVLEGQNTEFIKIDPHH
jgi:DNA polymerase I-like protein with 3'-5' exonuclease and polymerase domains